MILGISKVTYELLAGGWAPSLTLILRDLHNTLLTAATDSLRVAATLLHGEGGEQNGRN